MQANRKWFLAAAAAALFSGCAAAPALSFATPEEAMRAIVDASDDPAMAERLLGDGGFDMLRSGDEVADRQDLDTVRKLITEKVALENLGDGVKVALLGAEGWEFPIPLQQVGDRWTFDVEAGKEEILARRVGRNELTTAAVLRALVEAQREYAAEGRDGNPPVYAGRLFSSEGKHDGLYWQVAEGEPPSPIGPFLAEAAREGYRRSDGEPDPYHGYFYRLLTAQGPSAPGGARSYLDAQGRLSGGFAVIAWPATYDNSGVMTFVVNHLGIVFERDLGPDTERRAAAIRAFDPDDEWKPCID
jgi:hypothetical protein